LGSEGSPAISDSHEPGGAREQPADGGAPQSGGAWEAAVALLALRARSAEEIRRRLRRRRFPPAAIEAAIARLTAAGCLNDAAFAEAWARARQERQGMGPGRLARELAAKGVGSDDIAAALRALGAERDARDVAAEAAARRLQGLRTLPAETARRRLAAYLERRGFSAEIIVELCRRHFPRGTDTDDE
jgi:regulatory protein